MREQKLPCDGKCFSLPTSRIAAFYAGFMHVEGERHPKHLVHGVVHQRVHLSESRNSRNGKKLNAERCGFWARAKHPRGLEYAAKLKTEESQQPDITRAIRAVARELTPHPPVRSIEQQKKILRQRGLLS